MRNRTAWLAAVLLTVAVIGQPSVGRAADAVLERYSVRVGSTEAEGVQAIVTDPRFGNGTAQSRLVFRGADGTAPPTLALRVWRTVEPGEITFALLVFAVEIRGYDGSGALVYARDLAGFTFGDSAPGDWRRTLRDVPSATVRVSVAFVGNYE